MLKPAQNSLFYYNFFLVWFLWVRGRSEDYPQSKLKILTLIWNGLSWISLTQFYFADLEPNRENMPLDPLSNPLQFQIHVSIGKPESINYINVCITIKQHTLHCFVSFSMGVLANHCQWENKVLNEMERLQNSFENVKIKVIFVC